MIPFRLRIRFTKEGDLRLISHRDLVRTLERLFRRADIPLALSQGFHPKVRMTIPSALALGIVGCDEVMDVQLAEELSSETTHARLAAHAPPGMTIKCVEHLSSEARKARVESATYQVQLFPDRRPALQQAIDELLAQESFLIERSGAKKKLDLRADLQQLYLTDDAIVFTLRIRPEGAIRATEVLSALGVADFDALASPLSRTHVGLAT